MNPRIILFLLQLFAHSGLIYGAFNFTKMEWFIVFLVYFITGCLGVSITLHRYFAHKTFKMHKTLEYIGTACATYGLIGSSIAWVNNHRAHHYRTDKPDDPHSPLIHGYAQIQWFSMFYTKTRLRFIKDLMRDRFQCFAHQYYFHIHIVIILLFLLFGSMHSLSLYYLAPAAVLWNAGSMVNTLCHSSFGYVNHIIKDHSKNNLFLGFFVWGEGWHNNHHYLPNRVKYSERWWEFDISYQIIQLIRSR